MTKPRNLVVAQSGGPSPVINNTVRGVIEAARDLEAIGTVYGARHGIEGVLKEELLDLSCQAADEVSLLRYTPAAGAIAASSRRTTLLPATPAPTTVEGLRVFFGDRAIAAPAMAPDGE